MLIVAGTITIDPAHVDDLRSAAEVMMAATLQETGCHEYRFSESLASPGTIQVFEIWQSEEELAAHFETPHMATFRRVLANLDVQGRELHRYEVANVAKM